MKNRPNSVEETDKIKFLGTLAIKCIPTSMCLVTILFLITYFGGVKIDSNNIITKQQLPYIFLGIVLPLFILACFSSVLFRYGPVSSQEAQWTKVFKSLAFGSIILVTILAPICSGLFFVPESAVNRHFIIMNVRDSVQIVHIKTSSNTNWTSEDEWVFSPANKTLINAKANISFDEDSVQFPHPLPSVIEEDDEIPAYIVPLTNLQNIEWKKKPFKYNTFDGLKSNLFNFFSFSLSTVRCLKCLGKSNMCQRILYKVCIWILFGGNIFTKRKK